MVVVPGGPEGSARAGALPTPEFVGGPNVKLDFPTLLLASSAKTFGPATIHLDATVNKDTPLAASVLQLPAGPDFRVEKEIKNARWTRRRPLRRPGPSHPMVG